MRYFIDRRHAFVLEIGDEITAFTQTRRKTISPTYQEKHLSSDIANGYLVEITEKEAKLLIVRWRMQ